MIPTPAAAAAEADTAAGAADSMPPACAAAAMPRADASARVEFTPAAAMRAAVMPAIAAAMRAMAAAIIARVWVTAPPRLALQQQPARMALMAITETRAAITTNTARRSARSDM